MLKIHDCSDVSIMVNILPSALKIVFYEESNAVANHCFSIDCIKLKPVYIEIIKIHIKLKTAYIYISIT